MNFMEADSAWKWDLSSTISASAWVIYSILNLSTFQWCYHTIRRTPTSKDISCNFTVLYKFAQDALFTWMSLDWFWQCLGPCFHSFNRKIWISFKYQTPILNVAHYLWFTSNDLWMGLEQISSVAKLWPLTKTIVENMFPIHGRVREPNTGSTKGHMRSKMQRTP